MPDRPVEHGRGLPHGAIGNGALVALVHPDTGVDWLCLPRFDSPSVFARLLDPERGGTWRIHAETDVRRRRTAYLPNTNVLRTRIDAEDGSLEVIDFMPRLPEALDFDTPLRVTRLLRPLEGAPKISIEFAPRPDYGRDRPAFTPHPDGLSFRASDVDVHLRSNLPGAYLENGTSLRLDAPRYMCLEVGERTRTSIDQVEQELALTIAGWEHWAQRCSLSGCADDLVLRSALCLKQLASAGTGAIIAAATTSIPEAIGEPRTWDYRYCWLRDSVFAVEAFRRLGQLHEGRRFVRFVLDVAESGPLQPLYGIGGERDLPEFELDHLDGFLGTRPVRVGNAAATQLQTDLMGEVVLCMATILPDRRLPREVTEAWMPLLERMVEESIESFDVPDLGIWEYRAGPRRHVFSRAMCWAAVHHGAGLARAAGHPSLADRWDGRAASMRAEILRRGYSERLGMFTQSFEDEHADAANLLLPSIGLLPATDPRFERTLSAYRERLVTDCGVMRYVHEDDFGAPSSAFTICSFWWAEALALAGHLGEAEERFDEVARHANPLGLFSEDIGIETGELLGNFPQAYTHVGLINAALTIGTLQRARDGRFHAWT